MKYELYTQMLNTQIYMARRRIMTSFFFFFYVFVVMDDEEDECLLLYSKVSLLADFNGVFSGLNFVAFGLANFAVRINPKVLKPMLGLNGVSFFFTMLNTLPILPMQSFIWPIYPREISML